MALQCSTRVRNARAAAWEATIGASAILKIRSGAPPANCAAADSGTVLATLNLPSDWLTAPSAGAVGMNGLWQDLAADNAGNAAHFRIYDSGGSTCDIQGTVTATGGGGDMTVDNPSLAAGQQFTVTAFTITELNG